MDYARTIEGCRRGKARAQRALYDELAPMCMAVCHRYIEDRDEAQDMMQDGFVHIFEHLGELHEPERVRSWAYSVMVNKCVAYLRKARRLEVTTVEVPERAVGGEVALDRLALEEIRAAIDGLPVQQRTVFNLCAIDGYSRAEAARQMGISEGNVRLLLHRARVELKRRLGE